MQTLLPVSNGIVAVHARSDVILISLATAGTAEGDYAVPEGRAADDIPPAESSRSCCCERSACQRGEHTTQQVQLLQNSTALVVHVVVRPHCMVSQQPVICRSLNNWCAVKLRSILRVLVTAKLSVE